MSKSCNHNICKKTALSEAERVCDQLEARFTKHRRRVFEIVWQSHKAISASEIMIEMDNKQPPITYRALEFLKTAGLIHHITTLNAYIGCIHTKDPNHVGQLLICTRCNNVVELEPKKALMQLIAEAKQQGFSAEQTHIEMLGICNECE